MKIISLLFACLAFPLLSPAQVSLGGHVSDLSTGESLSGANITLDKTYQAAYSDASGNFMIRNLRKGKYHVSVSYVGYETLTREVELDKSASLDIALKQSPIVPEEVIISSIRADEKTPATFKNVPMQEIRQINLGQDLPVLLNATPSVVTTSDAGTGIGYTSIRIRGSDLSRINVTVNGIPLNDPESGEVYWVDLPDIASSIDNIQIQRGLGTSTNGAGAFGASINIRTLKPETVPCGRISSAAGSFNTLKNTLSFGSGLIDNKWTFTGRVSKISSDGYIDRAWSDLKSFFVSGSCYLKHSLFKANIFSGKERTYQAWYGVPQDSLKTGRTFNPYTYDNQTDNYQQDHYQLLWSQEAGSRWTLNSALHYTRGKGYYEEYEQDQALSKYGFDPVVAGSDTVFRTDLVRRRWLDNDFYGITWSADYDTRQRLHAILGGAWNEYDGQHYGEVTWAKFFPSGNTHPRYYDNKSLKKDFNVYGKASYQPAGGLNLYADLQYRRVSFSMSGIESDLENIGQEVNFDFFNPKAGLAYDFSSARHAYASLSLGHKEPIRKDYVGTSLQMQPRPESLVDLEAGYRQEGPSYTFTLNYYLMNYKDQLILTGKINDVGEYIRENVPDSYRTGVEFDGILKLTRSLELAASATLSRNKIRRFNEYLDNWDDIYYAQVVKVHKNTDIAFSPGLIASATLTCRPVKQMEISLFNKYVGKQYLDNTSSAERELKAYFTSDLRLSYRILPRFMKEIEINFMAVNLFNHLYESNGWTYSYIFGGKEQYMNYYFPQAGINFLGGVNLKF